MLSIDDSAAAEQTVTRLRAELDAVVGTRDAEARCCAALRLLLAESVREAGTLSTALEDARRALLESEQRLLEAESTAASRQEDCDALRSALQRVHAAAAATQEDSAAGRAAEAARQGLTAAGQTREVHVLQEQLRAAHAARESLRADLDLRSTELLHTRELLALRSDCLVEAERRCDCLDTQVRRERCARAHK